MRAKSVDQPLGPDELDALARAGAFPSAVQRCVHDRHWLALASMMTFAGGSRIPLADLVTAGRGLGALPDPGPGSRGQGLRGARLGAVDALLRRVVAPASTAEREAMVLAADLLATVGELRQSGEIFERAGDDGRAAELWAQLGEIERMEACLEREASRRSQRSDATRSQREIEDRLAAGARREAMALLASAPADTPWLEGLRQATASIRNALCLERSVVLSWGQERVRVAATPAVFGRQGDVDVPLRDPGVSRRHARIGIEGEGAFVEDLGSRGGTRLGGVPIAGRLPLPDEGELGLGASCVLAFNRRGDQLWLEGRSGLDRPLRCLVGPSPLRLGELGTPFRDLALDFSPSGVRWLRPLHRNVRLGGGLAGLAIDLAHGDVLGLEADGPGHAVEVHVE